MSPIQRYFYERAVRAHFKLSYLEQRQHKLAFIHELRTICNLPHKHQPLIETLSQLPSGSSSKAINNKLLALVQCVNHLLFDESNRVIVFVHNVETGNEIASQLTDVLGGRVSFVCAKDSKDEKDLKIKGAQKGSEVFKRVLILSQGIGSEGLCLHQFNHIICCDLPWNPSKWEQQIARAYRLGQKRQVNVHNMFQADDELPFSLDDYFKGLFEKKEKIIRSIFSGREGVLSMILPERQYRKIDDVVIERPSSEIIDTDPSDCDVEEEDDQAKPLKKSKITYEEIDLDHLQRLISQSQEALGGISQGKQGCALKDTIALVQAQLDFSSAEQYFQSSLIHAGLCEKSCESLVLVQKINKKEKSINDFNIHKFQLQLTENGADTTSSYFLFAEQRKLALKENQIPNDFSIDSAVELAQLYRGAGDREKYQYYSDLADQLSI